MGREGPTGSLSVTGRYIDPANHQMYTEPMVDYIVLQHIYRGATGPDSDRVDIPSRHVEVKSYRVMHT